MRTETAIIIVAGIVAAFGLGTLRAQAASDTQSNPQTAASARYLAPGLTVPAMDPERGKMLFASKGCVVCHSINGIGGTDAPKLDASTMPPAMNPFDFFAKMWRGAIAMITMQRSEIGHQIEFTGQDLADIVAFVHNPLVQKTFTRADIPPDIAEHIEEEDSGRGQGMMGGSQGMMRMKPKP